MSHVKLIIFDWDDVFTHGSTAGYYACYDAAARGVGVNLSKAEVKKRIDAKWGSSHVEEVKELLAEHPDLVDDAVNIYEKSYLVEHSSMN